MPWTRDATGRCPDNFSCSRTRIQIHFDSPRISYLIHDTIKGIIYKVTNTVETILPVVPSWTSVPYFAFFTITLQIDRPREKRNHLNLVFKKREEK